eukprot:jgi/Bigna1/88082/estExt_fgenesh1_pg.C_280006
MAVYIALEFLESLLKRSKNRGTLGVWKRRYFRFVNGTLSYYEDNQSELEKGSTIFEIGGYVMPVPEDEYSQKFAFELASEDRKYVLAAETLVNLERWLVSFKNYVIHKLNKFVASKALAVICSITSTKKMKDIKRYYVAYKIHCDNGAFSWSVSRRYSEFQSLHKRMLTVPPISKSIELMSFLGTIFGQTMSFQEMLPMLDIGDIILFQNRSLTASVQRVVTRSEYDHVAFVMRAPINSKRVTSLVLLEASAHGIKINPLESQVTNALEMDAKVAIRRLFWNLRTEAESPLKNEGNNPGGTLISTISSETKSNNTTNASHTADITAGVDDSKQKLKCLPNNEPYNLQIRNDEDVPPLSKNSSEAARRKYMEALKRLSEFATNAHTKNYSLWSAITGDETQDGYFCSQLVAAAYKELGVLSSAEKTTSYWPVFGKPVLTVYPYDCVHEGSFSDQAASSIRLIGAALSPEIQVFLTEEEKEPPDVASELKAGADPSGRRMCTKSSLVSLFPHFGTDSLPSLAPVLTRSGTAPGTKNPSDSTLTSSPALLPLIASMPPRLAQSLESGIVGSTRRRRRHRRKGGDKKGRHKGKFEKLRALLGGELDESDMKTQHKPKTTDEAAEIVDRRRRKNRSDKIRQLLGVTPNVPELSSGDESAVSEQSSGRGRTKPLRGYGVATIGPMSPLSTRQRGEGIFLKASSSKDPCSSGQHPDAKDESKAEVSGSSVTEGRSSKKTKNIRVVQL